MDEAKTETASAVLDEPEKETKWNNKQFCFK
jgi:hypothetical protein